MVTAPPTRRSPSGCDRTSASRTGPPACLPLPRPRSGGRAIMHVRRRGEEAARCSGHQGATHEHHPQQDRSHPPLDATETYPCLRPRVLEGIEAEHHRGQPDRAEHTTEYRSGRSRILHRQDRRDGAGQEHSIAKEVATLGRSRGRRRCRGTRSPDLPVPRGPRCSEVRHSRAVAASTSTPASAIVTMKIRRSGGP